MAGTAPVHSPDPADSKPHVKILADAPVPEDLLGSSHARVAFAIATLIKQGSDSARSIALTGSWGSGKSSIIEMLRRLLKQQTEPHVYEPLLFCFDAWSYQGDPLRRAFLDRLIEYAGQEADEAATQAWKEKLDLITGRREKSEARADRPLTGLGLAVAISLLFCIPLGGAFYGKADPLHFFKSNWFGWLAIATYSVPLFFTLCAYLKERDFEAFKSLLLREARQDTTTTIVKTKEPSSIDFQALFADIVAFLLREPERHLVVVIDNLDRIDAQSAVSMWATMRVFFELDHRADKWKNRVWLIVPFDKEALRGLWKSPEGQDSESFVDSFLHKTFQVTFHVSPPILTKWKPYFAERLKEAFPGDRMSDARDTVFTLFALKQTSPSPREMKIFINKVSALYLQRMDEPSQKQVDLPYLAAYILNEPQIKPDGSGLTSDAVASRDMISLLESYMPGGDYLEQLSAVHFNVDPSEAIQVLIGSRFNAALEADNQEELERLRASPHFWPVINRYVPTQLLTWSKTPKTLAQVANFMEKAEARDKTSLTSAPNVWPAIVITGRDIADWGDLDAVRAAAFPSILKRVSSDRDDITPLSKNILAYLSDLPAKITPAREFSDSWITACRGALEEMKNHSRAQPFVKKFDVAEAQNIYLHLCAAATRQAGAEVVTPHLKCSNPQDVPSAFAAFLPTTDGEEFLRLRDFLVANLQVSWGTFDTDILAALPNLPPETAATGVRAVLRPRAQAVDSTLLPQFAQIALKKLAEPQFEQKKQWQPFGALAAAGLLAPSVTSPPFDIVGKLQQTIPPEWIDSLVESLTEFGLTPQILDSANTLNWAQALIARFADSGRIGDLDAPTLIRNYLHLPADLKAKLISAAPKSDKLLARLEQLNLLDVATHSLDFIKELLPLLNAAQKERLSLTLARLPVSAPSVNAGPLLVSIAENIGPAWIPLEFAKNLLPKAEEKLKPHLERRIEIGERSVAQLLSEAQEASPRNCDKLRDFAIDRARADYAFAQADRNDALVAWGQALLDRSERFSWAQQKLLVERAQQLFAEALAIRKTPLAIAGAAAATEVLAGPLADEKALPLLDQALRDTLEFLRGSVFTEEARKSPELFDSVLCTAARIRMSRARRQPSLEHRKLEFEVTEDDLINQLPEANWSWKHRLLLAECLTERGGQQHRTEPFERAEQYLASKGTQPLQLAITQTRHAAYALRERTARLSEESEKILTQRLSEDPADYAALITLGDVLSQRATRTYLNTSERSDVLVAAKKKYTEAAQADPARPDAYAGLASACLLQARSAKGESVLTLLTETRDAARQALNLRPDYIPALLALGNAAALEAKQSPPDARDRLFEESYSYFNQAVAREDICALADLAIAEVASGEFNIEGPGVARVNSATDHVETALSLDPRNPFAMLAKAHTSRAYALRDSLNRAELLKRARQQYDMALGISPDLDGGAFNSVLSSDERALRQQGPPSPPP
jgi:hypothetical protein